MTADKELWALFRAEADEHLQILDAGLLRLENDAQDRATLELVFRSAHSLKGAARMMGALGVEREAHGFEDALMAAAKHGQNLEESTIERLYRDLDALRASVTMALAADKSDVAPAAAVIIESHVELVAPTLETLPEKSETSTGASETSTGASETSTGASETSTGASETSTGASETSTGASETSMPATSAIVGAPEVEAWKIETMRVDTARLDGLLAMAGELVVSTKRAGGGKTEFESAQTLREEVQKLGAQQKRVLRALQGSLGRENATLLRDVARLLGQYEAKWDAISAIVARLQGAHDGMARLENVVGELEAAIRGVRLLPLSTLFGQFPRSVRDLAKAQGKRVDFSIEGGETTADKRVLEELKDPLMHMIRNAVDHGIETPAARLDAGKTAVASLQLRGSQTATHVVIELQDDGRGLDVEAIRASALTKEIATAAELAAMPARQIQDLIFAPGFSTAAALTDVSGRGVGLDVVRENMARLRGGIEVSSRPGRGCTFRLIVPLTLATTRVLLVRAGAATFALPLENVAGVRLLRAAELFALQGRSSFDFEAQPAPVADLSALLALETAENGAPIGGDPAPCVVLMCGAQRLGLRVDEVVEEQEIILKPLSRALENLRHVAGATILGTGEVCLLLAPAELLQIAARQSARDFQSAPRVAPTTPKIAVKTLLLAEDSIVTRTQEKRILEGAGYRVVTAVDGLDAWQKLGAGAFDGVISDIEMPNLDGLSLTARIREHPKYDELPIILVSSLASESDRRRGVEVGANAYIAKSDFDQKALLETLRTLV